MKLTSITIGPKITSQTYVLRKARSFKVLSARRLWLGFLVLILITAPISAAILHHTKTQAAAPYSASDLLGQTDSEGDPVFTSNFANNANGANGFTLPADVAVDTTNHRLFVADMENGRVLIFNLDSSNNLIDRIADNVLGQANLSTAIYSETSQNYLAGPTAVAYDSTNNRLFVADTFQNRILVFDVASITDGEDAVNVLGQPDFVSSDSDTTQSTLDEPYGASYDSLGNRLFVQDTMNNRVLIFDVASITNGENAVNVLGQPDFVSSGTGITASTMNEAYGKAAIDTAGNRLFVNDSGNYRILVFDITAITNGEDAVNVLGQADFDSNDAATTQNGLYGLVGLDYDSVHNRLFATEGNGNSRVLVFDVTAITNGENAVFVLGQTDFVSSDPDTTQSTFSGVQNVSYDSGNDRLYAADFQNHRILVFDVTAITNGENAVDIIGQTDENGDPVYTTDNVNNSVVNSIGFSYAPDVALDSVNHRLFVADQANDRVLVFNMDADNNLLDRTADNVLGQPDFVSNDEATTQSGMADPGGVTYDAVNNRLFVADSSNVRVTVFDVTAITNGENAAFVLGQPDFVSNDEATTQSGMADGPTGTAYDSTGNRLFVMDNGNARILVYDVTAITNGENAINVLGKADFTTYGCSLTQSSLCGAYGKPAYDATNNRLFVGDDSRVMVFDVTAITNGENAINVLGESDFTSGSYEVTQNGFSSVVGVDYDSVNDRLYVADGNGNNRVMVFDVASITNGEDAVDVIGQPDFTTSTAAATQEGIFNVQNITYGSENNHLYVADSANNRIMIFDFDEESSGSSSGSYTNRSPSTPAGLPYTPPTPGQPYIPGTTPTNGGHPSNPANPKNPSNAPLIAPVDKFLRNLGFGSVGEDVKRLQQFLNVNVYNLSPTGAGSTSNETTFFGPKTFQAVKTFQETFASAILTPLGLSQGTGFFGNATRAFVNSLLK